MRYEPTPEYAELIGDLLRNGRYANAAAVLEAALDLLREQEAARDPDCTGDWTETELRAEIQKAEDDIAAGRVTRYETGDQLAEEIKQWGRATLAGRALK